MGDDVGTVGDDPTIQAMDDDGGKFSDEDRSPDDDRRARAGKSMSRSRSRSRSRSPQRELPEKVRTCFGCR
ncbi:hypothetical protein N9L76_09965 [bacterium]|nr:hypothetical protein [bacterium]